MSYMPSNPPPLDELELNELFVALYPEKFSREEDDDLWDEVQAFVDEITQEQGGDNPIKDLLARIVYLAPRLSSPLSGKVHHALGKPFGNDGFLCVVKREPNQ